MAIESICQGCGRKLRAADEHAGKKARCPQCRTIYTVPPAVTPSSFRDSGGTAADAWYLETDGGQTYGPVSRSELDAWFNQDRLTATSRVRQEGGISQSAIELYPSLAEGMPAQPQANPFAEQKSSNPYAAPQHSEGHAAVQAAGPHAAHRGGMVLTLGILSLCCNFLCCCCFLSFIPGICAWTMGRTDLQQMSAGRMDPSGRSTTQAGMVLGIIGTVISTLAIIFQVLMAIADAG